MTLETMSRIKISKDILGFIQFVKSIQSQSDPIPLGKTNLETDFFQQIHQINANSNQFYLAINLTPEILFSHRSEKYILPSQVVEIKHFLELIHPEYSQDFLQCLKAVFGFTRLYHHEFTPFQHRFRISVPLRLKNHQYFWVFSEIFPVQQNENHHFTVYYMIFNILHALEDKKHLPVTCDIWDDNQLNNKMTKAFWRYRFSLGNFHLPAQLIKILEFLRSHPDATNAEIAAGLGKSKNTIDKQNKTILNMSNHYFTGKKFKSVREVLQLLENIGYFESW